MLCRAYLGQTWASHILFNNDTFCDISITLQSQQKPHPIWRCKASTVWAPWADSIIKVLHLHDHWEHAQQARPPRSWSAHTLLNSILYELQCSCYFALISRWVFDPAGCHLCSAHRSIMHGCKFTVTKFNWCGENVQQNTSQPYP